MKKNDPFIIERTYNAPVDVVWKAITDKEQMKQWYFDLAAFKPEVGFEFQFHGQGHKGEKYLHLCKITDVIPHKKLSYSWRYEGYPGNSLKDRPPPSACIRRPGTGRRTGCPRELGEVEGEGKRGEEGKRREERGKRFA